jgi:hypothetical protein
MYLPQGVHGDLLLFLFLQEQIKDIIIIGAVAYGTVSLPPVSSFLTHTRKMDGFCNQNTDQLGSLSGLSFPVVYVGVVACAPSSLPPVSSSLTHTHTGRMYGFCNQNTDQLGSPRTIFSRCICRCSRIHSRLPLHILLLHTQVSR